MGREHQRERELARDRLELLHDRNPHQYPQSWVFATWEELWWRWWEELKDCLNQMRVEMQSPTLTKDMLRHYALAPRGGGGGPRLQLPTAFQLDDPQAYYLNVIEPKIKRKYDRVMWKQVWGNKSDSKGAGDEEGGETEVQEARGGKGAGKKGGGSRRTRPQPRLPPPTCCHGH